MSRIAHITKLSFYNYKMVCVISCVCVGESESNMLEKALQRMSDRVKQRRVLTKPCFQDFDK